MGAFIQYQARTMRKYVRKIAFPYLLIFSRATPTFTNKIRYIPLVMASSRVIEIEEYEEVVGYPDSSPVLRRSSSAESVNDVSPFQEPMMEVEEFAPTSRPTLRYTEPELAKQTQVPRKCG